MQMPSVPKLRVPNRYVPGTPDLEVPLPELNSGRSMNTMPRVFTDPLLNTRVRNYYRNMYEQNVANEIGGRVVGGVIGAGAGAGLGSVIGATVAGLGTLISLAVPGDFGAISAASIAAGAKLGFNIGAGVGAAGGIIGGDYSTWYATGDLLRNTAGKIFTNPAEGILNSLYAVGKTMDIVQGGEALRASLYSLVKGENVGENILKAYGLHSSGRQDYDFERIREELGIDLGTFPNFIVDFLGDVLTDPGFVASVTKIAFSKSAAKNISKVLKSNDEIINILKTSDALEEFSTTLSKNDNLLKQVSKGILEQDYETIAYLVASDTSKVIDTADGSVSKILQKFVDETRKQSLKNVSNILWEWGNSVDEYDDLITGVLFDVAMPPVAAIKLSNKAKRFIKSPSVAGDTFISKTNYFLFGNKADWSFEEQFAEGYDKQRAEVMKEFFSAKGDKKIREHLVDTDYANTRDMYNDVEEYTKLKQKVEDNTTLSKDEMDKMSKLESKINNTKKVLETRSKDYDSKIKENLNKAVELKDKISKLDNSSPDKVKLLSELDSITKESDTYGKTLAQIDSSLDLLNRPTIHYKLRDIMNKLNRIYALTKITGGKSIYNDSLKKSFDGLINQLIKLISSSDENSIYILDVLEGTSYGRFFDFIRENLDKESAKVMSEMLSSSQKSYDLAVKSGDESLFNKYNNTLKEIKELEDFLEQSKKDLDKLRKEKTEVGNVNEKIRHHKQNIAKAKKEIAELRKKSKADKLKELSDTMNKIKTEEYNKYKVRLEDSKRLGGTPEFIRIREYNIEIDYNSSLQSRIQPYLEEYEKISHEQDYFKNKLTSSIEGLKKYIKQEQDNIKMISNIDDLIKQKSQDIDTTKFKLEQNDKLIKQYIIEEELIYKMFNIEERYNRIFIDPKIKLNRVDKIIPTRDKEINKDLFIQVLNAFKNLSSDDISLDTVTEFSKELHSISNTFTRTSAAGGALFKVYEAFKKRNDILQELSTSGKSTTLKQLRFIGNIYTDDTINIKQSKLKLFSRDDLRYVIPYIDTELVRLQESLNNTINKNSKSIITEKINKLNSFRKEIETMNIKKLPELDSRFYQYTQIVDETGQIILREKSVPMLLRGVYSIKDLEDRLNIISGKYTLDILRDNFSNRVMLQNYITTLKEHLHDKFFMSRNRLQNYYNRVVHKLEDYFNQLDVNLYNRNPEDGYKALSIFQSIYEDLDNLNKLLVINGLRDSLVKGINKLPNLSDIDEQIDKLTKELNELKKGAGKGEQADYTEYTDEVTGEKYTQSNVKAEQETDEYKKNEARINYELSSLQKQKSYIIKTTEEHNYRIKKFDQAFDELLKQYDLKDGNWFLDGVSVNDIVWEYAVKQCYFKDSKFNFDSELFSDAYKLKTFYTNAAGAVRALAKTYSNDTFIITLDDLLNKMSRLSDPRDLSKAQELFFQLIHARDNAKIFVNNTKFKVESFFEGNKIKYKLVNTGLSESEISKVNKALNSVITSTDTTLSNFVTALEKEGVDPELLGYTPFVTVSTAYKDTYAFKLMEDRFKPLPHKPKQRTLLYRRPTSNANPNYIYTLDVETSDKGLTEGGKPLITQLAITKVDLNTGKTTKVYNKYINPDDYKRLTSSGRFNSNESALKVGGNPLSDNWSEHKLDWVTLEQMQKDFYNLTELWNDDSIVLAHNGNFDMSVLMSNFSKESNIIDKTGLVNPELYEKIGFNFNFADSLSISRMYNISNTNTNMELARMLDAEYDELYDIDNEFDENKIKQTGLFKYYFKGEEGSIECETYFNGKTLHDAEVDTQVTAYWTRELFYNIRANLPENVNIFDVLQNPTGLGQKITVDDIDDHSLINLNKLLGDEEINTREIKYIEDNLDKILYEIGNKEQYIIKNFPNKPKIFNQFSLEKLIDLSYRLDNDWDRALLIQELLEDSSYGIGKDRIEAISIRDILDTLDSKKKGEYGKEFHIKEIMEIDEQLGNIQTIVNKTINKNKADHENFIKIMNVNCPTASLMKNRNWVRMSLIGRISCDDNIMLFRNIINGDLDSLSKFNFSSNQRDLLKVFSSIVGNPSVDEARRFLNSIVDDSIWEDEILKYIYENKNQSIDLFYQCLDRSRDIMQKFPNLSIDEFRSKLLIELQTIVTNKFNENDYLSSDIIAKIVDKVSDKYELGEDFVLYGDASGFTNKMQEVVKTGMLDPISEVMHTNTGEFKEKDNIIYNEIFDIFRQILEEYRATLRQVKKFNKMSSYNTINLRDFVANTQLRPSELVKENYEDVLKLNKEVKQSNKIKRMANELFSEYYKPYDSNQSKFYVDAMETRNVRILNKISKTLGLDLIEFMRITKATNFKYINKDLSNLIWDDILQNPDHPYYKLVVDLEVEFKSFNEDTLNYINDIEEYIQRIKNIFVVNYMENKMLTSDLTWDKLYYKNINVITKKKLLEEGINLEDLHKSKLKSSKDIESMKLESRDLDRDTVNAAIQNIDAIKDSNNLFRNICNIYGTNPTKISEFFKSRKDLILVYMDPSNFNISKMNVNEYNITNILQSKNLDSFAVMSKDDYYKLVKETQPIKLPQWLSSIHKYLILPIKLFSLYYSVPFLVNNMGSAYLQNINANGGDPVTAISDLVNMAKYYTKWKELYMEATSNAYIWHKLESVENVEANWYDFLISNDEEFLSTLSEDDLLYKFIKESTDEEREMFVKISQYAKTSATYSEIIGVQRNIRISEKKKEELKMIKEKASKGDADSELEYYVIREEPNEGFKTIKEEFESLKRKKDKNRYDYRRYHTLKKRLEGKFGEMMSKVYKYTGLQKWLDINADIENIFRMAMLDNLMKNGSDFSSATNEVIRRHFIYNDKSEFDRLLEVFMPFSTYPIKAANLFTELTEDASFVKMMYLYNKYSWGDEDESRSDYLQKRKVRGDVPFGNQLLGLGNAFTESLYTLMNPVESINNKLNPLLKPIVDLATNAQYNRITQLPLVSHGANIADTIQSAKQSGTFNAGQLLGMSRTYYRYDNNYYNKPRYPQRSYLYKNLYTKGGYSRVAMGMQQTTLDNLQYRVSDILYKTRYRHK